MKSVTDNRKKMLRFRATEFTKGLVDSCRVWQAFQSSRTLRDIAWRLFPLHATTIVLGLWYHSIDVFGLHPDDWFKHAVLWTMWSVLWGAPVYVLGSLLQLRYAWRIRAAATAHREVQQKRDITNVVTETLYGALLNLTFLFQVWFVNMLTSLLFPAFLSSGLKTVFNIVNLAWATSFAAFESRLITKNQDLFQRVYFVETHWAYALGYGTIASVAYHVVPGAIANGLWQYSVLLLMLNAMRLSLLKLPVPFVGAGGASGVETDRRDEQLKLRGSPMPRRRRRRPDKVCDMGRQLRYRLRVFWLAQKFAIYVMHQLNLFLQSIGAGRSDSRGDVSG
jgi:hypothetical protein